MSITISGAAVKPRRTEEATPLLRQEEAERQEIDALLACWNHVPLARRCAWGCGAFVPSAADGEPCTACRQEADAGQCGECGGRGWVYAPVEYADERMGCPECGGEECRRGGRNE